MRIQLMVTALLLALIVTWPVQQRAQMATRSTLEVAINEVAWSGTPASSGDEWIELRNNTNREIDLSGWTLRWGEGEGEIVIRFDQVSDGANTRAVRRSTLPPRGFYLLERTDDQSVSDVEADLIYTGALSNGGEILKLLDVEGRLVDTANGDGGAWPGGAAGGGEVPYATMERLDPTDVDTDENWGSNDGVIRNGTDSDGNPINGTPKAENSRKKTG